MKNIVESSFQHMHRSLHVSYICHPVFISNTFDDHFINVTKTITFKFEMFNPE